VTSRCPECTRGLSWPAKVGTTPGAGLPRRATAPRGQTGGQTGAQTGGQTGGPAGRRSKAPLGGASGVSAHAARQSGPGATGSFAWPGARILGLALVLVPAGGVQPVQAQALADQALADQAFGDGAPGPAGGHGPSYQDQADLPRDPFVGVPEGPLLRRDVAGTRRIPGYVPPGVDLGGLHLAPMVTAGVLASSNVFNRSAGSRGDLRFSLAPGLLASGSAGRASYVLDARAGLARYARLHAYDNDTWALRAQAGLPLSGELAVAASGAASRRVEPPYEAAGATAGLDGVVLVDQVRAALGTRLDLGITRVTGTLELARSHYLPVRAAAGGAGAQGFRDDRDLAASLRVEHSLGARRALFAEATQRWIRSLHPGTAPDRTASSGEALLGITGDLGHLVSAEVAAGYQWRNYRSAALRDYRGLAWRARIEWYPTPLLSLALGGRRDVVNSPLPAAAGVTVDRVSLKALYEARRNFGLVLSASRAVERYRDLGGAGPGGSPAVRSQALGVEGRYAAGRNLLFTLSAGYRDRRSDAAQLPRQGRAFEGGLSVRFAL